MARVPTLLDNSVQLRPVTGERIAVSDSGSAQIIGRALQGLGQQMDAAAKVQDETDAIYDRANASQVDAETIPQFMDIRTRFEGLRGLNAKDGAEAAATELAKAKADALAKAKTPRARAMLSSVLDQRSLGVTEFITGHVQKETVKAEDDASLSRQSASATAAVYAVNPEERKLNLDTALNEASARGARQGRDKAVVELEQLGIKSGVHSGIIRNYVDDDNVSAAIAYRDANIGNFTVEDDATVDRMLHDPIMERRADAHLTAALSGKQPGDVNTGSNEPEAKTPPKPIVRGTNQDALRSGAERLGIKPHELAMIAYYESGGTLNPRIAGGDGGKYVGLFQMGREERIKFWGHADARPDFPGQIEGLVKYAEARGFKPGMGWKKLYTTINAGNPYEPVTKRDSNGSQSDHYSNIERQYSGKAKEYMGGDDSGPALGGEAQGADDLTRTEDYLRAGVANGTISPEMADRVRMRAQRQVNFKNSVAQQQESEATRSAYEIIDKLPGNKLTSMRQLPAELVARLPATTRIGLEADIARNNAPKEPKPNGDAATIYGAMAANHPEEFVALMDKQDIRSLKGQMSPGEWQNLFTLYDKLKTNPRGPAWVTHTSMMSVIKTNAPYIGLDLSTSGGKFANQKDANDAQALAAMMKQDLDSITGGTREPTPQEIEGAFNKATMEGRVKKEGWLWDSEEKTRRFRARAAGETFVYDVPRAENDRIVTAIKAVKGSAYTPSQQEIGDYYLKYKGRAGYWQ